MLWLGLMQPTQWPAEWQIIPEHLKQNQGQSSGPTPPSSRSQSSQKLSSCSWRREPRAAPSLSPTPTHPCCLLQAASPAATQFVVHDPAGGAPGGDAWDVHSAKSQTAVLQNPLQIVLSVPPSQCPSRHLPAYPRV